MLVFKDKTAGKALQIRFEILSLRCVFLKFFVRDQYDPCFSKPTSRFEFSIAS